MLPCKMESLALYIVLVIIASLSDVMISAGASNYSDDVRRSRDSKRHNLLALDNGQSREILILLEIPNNYY